MPVDITLAIAWEGPRNQYDTDDIIDVFRYDGDIPSPPSAPWVHIHVLNAPWDTLQAAKDVLLEPNAEDEPDPVPPDYDPVVMNARRFRTEKANIPNNIKNQINRDRMVTFDFSLLADAKIYNKKLQRLMQLADWGL